MRKSNKIEIKDLKVKTSKLPAAGQVGALNLLGGVRG